MSSPTCASCVEWVYVCAARGFTSTSLYPLIKSLFVHFSISPLGQVISPVLCYNHVCVYVVLCVSVCMCGGAPLSLDRRGDVCMVVEWPYSRGWGEAQG